MKRILVCGGRDYANSNRSEYKHVHRVLMGITHALTNEYIEDDNWLPSDITIIEGGARGVDSAAYDFAVVHYTGLLEFKADWDKYGKAAGPIRNQQMLDEGKPDLVIAFPGGVGTADMVRRSKLQGIPVIEIN